MVFCGHCGYQLAPGDKICPQCGAETDIDQLETDPGSYNPTEISHAVLDQAQFYPPQNNTNLPTQSTRVPQQGQIILGQGTGYGNEAMTMMSSQIHPPQQPQQQMYVPPVQQPPQQVFPTYPPQGTSGMYGYNAGGYPPYQGQGQQSAAITRLIESSRRGKTTALLLILLGLLLLIVAIVVFILSH